MTKFKLFESEVSVSKALADYIVKLSAKSIAKSGRFTIALSGGSTPDKLYSLLATEPYSSVIDWKNVFVFWGDERYLPSTNPDNNSRQAKTLFLSNVGIPAENIFPVPVRLAATKAAAHYEQTLQQFFKQQIPQFDLILLGMGDNGHTASLFPYSTILGEKTALVQSVFVEEVNMYRISFTIPLIHHAKNIVFMVTGKNKSSMLQKVIEGQFKGEKYPAQLIKPNSKGKLYWYVDKAAASKLKENYE